MNPSSLIVESLRKVRFRGRLKRRKAFELNADFALAGPNVVGVLGGNGAGKSTLFDLIAGAEAPTGGRVLCAGRDIHRVRYHHRARLVHYRQQRFTSRESGFREWSAPVLRAYEMARAYDTVNTFAPAIHLFDEPDMKDGYMELRLNFIHELRALGQLVLISIHPHDTRDLGIIRRLCDRYLFLERGRVSPFDDFDALIANPDVRHYLGDSAPARADDDSVETVDHTSSPTASAARPQ